MKVIAIINNAVKAREYEKKILLFDGIYMYIRSRDSEKTIKIRFSDAVNTMINNGNFYEVEPGSANDIDINLAIIDKLEGIL